MCEIEGTKIDVKFDQMAEAVVITIGDGAIPTEEVIRHLGSEYLARRTRDRLFGDIGQRVGEASTELVLTLKGAWESWIEFDIRDAIKSFLAQWSVAAA